MYSMEFVAKLVESMKEAGKPRDYIVRETGKACVGWPYVFGAWGEECTPANRKRRASSAHPTIVSKCQVLNGSKKTCDGCKWDLPVRMFDCRGFTYWVLLQVGIKLQGQGATSQYNTNSNWVIKGDIKDMPRDKVCCVFTGTAKTKEHTGLYNGDGTTTECSSGVQYFDPMKSKWKYYGLPKGLYDEDPTPAPEPTPTPVKHKTLRKGDKGPEVKEMQELLMKKGESLPRYGADGDFGNETLRAVKSFQKNNGLVVDGVVGKKTWAALES